METQPPLIATTAELLRWSRDVTCSLVSMDIEGGPENALEIGLAVCKRVGPVKPYFHSYSTFLDQNSIGCWTIPLRPFPEHRRRCQERLRFGDDPADIDDDPGSTIRRHLQPCTNRLILAVHDHHTELSWLRRACPDILRRVIVCIDVQKFLLMASTTTSNQRPPLRQSLAALFINEGVPEPKRTRPHRAVNDAVYTLAITAALLSRSSDAPPLQIALNEKRPRLFYGRPHPSQNFPFTALIRTLDCSPLPDKLDTAGKIYNHFRDHDPVTAGTGRTRKTSSKGQQSSWSWICFGSRERLDKFYTEVNHTSAGGKHLLVESQYFPGITLTAEERKAKQLRDGDRIREERREARRLVDALG